MKFLLDENQSPAQADTLRRSGHDALSGVEIGLSGADDLVVRATAVQTGRILITLVGDFGNVLRYPPATTPGVIRLRLHPPTENSTQTTLRWVVSEIAGTDIVGKLVVATETKIRIRG